MYSNLERCKCARFSPHCTKDYICIQILRVVNVYTLFGHLSRAYIYLGFESYESIEDGYSTTIAFHTRSCVEGCKCWS